MLKPSRQSSQEFDSKLYPMNAGKAIYNKAIYKPEISEMDQHGPISLPAFEPLSGRVRWHSSGHKPQSCSTGRKQRQEWQFKNMPRQQQPLIRGMPQPLIRGMPL